MARHPEVETTQAGQARSSDGGLPRLAGLRWWLAGATAVGLAIRWVWILVVRPVCPSGAVTDTGGCLLVDNLNDANYVHTQGLLIAQGHWFKDPFTLAYHRESAGKPPVYPLFLGFLSWFGANGAMLASLVVAASVVALVWLVARRLTNPRAAVAIAVLAGAGLAALLVLDGTSVQVQRLTSAAVGSSTVLLVGLVARRLFGDRAAVMAAVVAAVHPALWVNDVLLTVECLYAPIVCLVVLAAYRFADVPSWWRAAGLGALVAVAALTRAEALLLFVAVGLPLCLGARTLGLRQRVERLAVVGISGLLVLAPWVLWNQSRFEQAGLLAMSSGAGSVLSGGSCDPAFYGQHMGYWGNCMDDPLVDVVGPDEDGAPVADVAQRILGVDGDEGTRLVVAGAVNVDGQPVVAPDIAVAAGQEVSVQLAESTSRAGRTVPLLDESEKDRVVRNRAVEYLGDHLTRYPVVVVARLGREFGVFRPLDQLDKEAGIEARGRAESAVGLGVYYLLLAPAAVGLVSLRRRGLPLSPLLGLVAAVVVTTAASFAVWRYRVPADIALCVLAAGGVDHLLARGRSRAAPLPSAGAGRESPTPAAVETERDPAATPSLDPTETL